MLGLVAIPVAGVIALVVVLGAAGNLPGQDDQQRDAAGAPDQAPTEGSKPGATGTPSGTTDAGSPSNDGGDGAAPVEVPEPVTSLESVVLRGSDLPVGWRVHAEAGTVVPRLLGGCLEPAISPTEAHSRITVVLQRGSSGPVISNTVVGLADAADSANAFRRAVRAAERCSKAGRTPTGATLTRLLRPGGDPGATALGITLRSGSGTTSGEYLLTRSGRRIIVLVSLGQPVDGAASRKALAAVLDRARG